MNKVKTTKIGGGAEYARVPDRLKAFWEANPKGKIETEPTVTDGKVIFKAVVSTGGENPKESTGHSMGEVDKKKEFEKQETIAVGRALALLGYLGSGEIASSEEMEEFLSYQTDKENKLLEEAKNALEAVKTIEELKKTWSAMPLVAKNKLADLKDEIKGGFNAGK